MSLAQVQTSACSGNRGRVNTEPLCEGTEMANDGPTGWEKNGKNYAALIPWQALS